MPGLHITLGIFLKLFRAFEQLAKNIDIKIAEDMAIGNHNDNDFGLSEYVRNLKSVAENEEKVLELEGMHQLIVEELNWFAVTQDNFFDEEYHNNLLDEIGDEILHCNNNIAQSREKTKVFDAGPCYVSIDGTLNKIGVEREKYFGGCFVGKDCHKILRDDNLSLLCDSLPITVNEKTFSDDVYDLLLKIVQRSKYCFQSFLSVTEYLILHNT